MIYCVIARSKVESEAIQSHVFRLGGTWINGCCDMGYPATNSDGELFFIIGLKGMVTTTQRPKSEEVLRVDKFLEVKKLPQKPVESQYIGNSRGIYRLKISMEGAFSVVKDTEVTEREVANGIRFDTREQANYALVRVQDTIKCLQYHYYREREKKN